MDCAIRKGCHVETMGATERLAIESLYDRIKVARRRDLRARAAEDRMGCKRRKTQILFPRKKKPRGGRRARGVRLGGGDGEEMRLQRRSGGGAKITNTRERRRGKSRRKEKRRQRKKGSCGLNRARGGVAEAELDVKTPRRAGLEDWR
jgi:hypothetical protein